MRGVALLFLILPLYGQALYLMKSGGELTDRVEGIAGTADGYVIAGETQSVGAGNFDLFFAKADIWGNWKWGKVYGLSYIEIIRDLKAFDCGYVFSGYTSSIGGGFLDAIVGVLSLQGRIKWIKTIGVEGPDIASCIIPSNDGFVVFVGHSQDSEDVDILLGKLDFVGVRKFIETIGSSNDEVAFSVVQAEDSTYFITGYVEMDSTWRDVLVMRVDPMGHPLWARSYGAPGEDVGKEILEFGDSTLFVIGEIEGIEGKDILFLRLNRYGDIVFKEAIDLGQCEVVNKALLADNYIYLSGVTGTDTLGKFFLGRINIEDNLQMSFKLMQEDAPSSIYALSACGEYIVAGGEDNKDFILAFLDGLEGCGLDSVTPVIYTPELSLYYLTLSVDTPSFTEKYLYLDSLQWMPDKYFLCSDTLNLPPSSFSLLYPENGGVFYPLDTLKWQESVDPDSGDSALYVVLISTNPNFYHIVVRDTVSENCYCPAPLEAGQYYWKVGAFDTWGLTTWSSVWSFTIGTYTSGDVNGDGLVDQQDFIYLGQYLYEGGPAPVPLISGDVNGDCEVNQSDFLYLGNYLFLGGPPPRYCGG